VLALLAAGGELTAAVSVRGLDDELRERLRVRAARHGRSMESEIRCILADAVREPSPSHGLFAALLDRFGELGGVELELPARLAQARGVDL